MEEDAERVLDFLEIENKVKFECIDFLYELVG